MSNTLDVTVIVLADVLHQHRTGDAVTFHRAHDVLDRPVLAEAAVAVSVDDDALHESTTAMASISTKSEGSTSSARTVARTGGASLKYSL